MPLKTFEATKSLKDAEPEAVISRTLEGFVNTIEHYYDDDFSSHASKMTHAEALKIANILLEGWMDRLTGYEIACLLSRLRRGESYHAFWYRSARW